MMWTMSLCLKLAAFGLGGGCVSAEGPGLEMTGFSLANTTETAYVTRCKVASKDCAASLRANRIRPGHSVIWLPRHQTAVSLPPGVPEETQGAIILAAEAFDRQP